MKLSTLAFAGLRVDGIPSLAEVVAREGPLYKVVVEGQTFKKVSEKGKLEDNCALRFDPSLHTLFVGTKKKKEKLLDVECLKEVRVGFLTHTMLDHAERLGVDETCAMSIVYDLGTANSLPGILNLVAPTPEKRQTWAHALNLLIQTLCAANAEAYSLMRPWAKSLTKGNDFLDWKATNLLLDSLNIPIRASDIEGFSKKDKFYFADFIRLVRGLRAHQVGWDLFAKYGKSNIFSTNFDDCSNPLMNLKQFRELMKKEQGEDLTEEQAKALIQKYSLGSGKLDHFAFQNWIISADNDVWDPEKLKAKPLPNKPLPLFFCSSSHNSYLSGHQLNGISSIEMYIRVLKSGCRCLEIDIWDGPNGEPIVYHGYTLTSKIWFRDVLRVIKSHGFVASPYPIILSFENHCSKAVQDKMALYIKEILGDMVQKYVKTGGSKVLPSPNELRGKVLIKGSSHVSHEQEMYEEMEEINEALKQDALGGLAMSREEIAFVQDKLASKRKDASKVEKVSQELDSLIYLRAKKLAKFPQGYDSFEPNNMTSFSENRINRILQTDAGFQHLRKYNSSYISRVYPKGTRFDSSNYDPIVFWYAGCQMLALNFQTSTTPPMLINWAKFREHGACGYIERPEHINEVVKASGSVQCGNLFAKVDRFRRPISSCSKVRIQIFGARMLPRGNTCVEVMLHDGGTTNELRYRTNVCKTESFSPNFDFDKIFPIADSANSFFTFIVYSKEVDFAYFAIPLESMREGYRVVRLMDSNYDPIEKGMCHLLIRVEKFAKDVPL